MQTTDTPVATTPAATQPRLDFYAGIHKALRLFMTDTLVRTGSTDPRDGTAVASTLGQVEGLLAACEAHLQKEDIHVHPLLEAALPGSAGRIAAEHVEHLEAIASLRDLTGLVRHAAGPRRGAAMHRLYLALARFVAENFVHMEVEETQHNAVLWAHYSDPELNRHHDRLLASIEPGEMMALLGWFMPALSAPERAGMLGAMRAGVPAAVFGAVMGLARERLDAGAFERLQADLAVA